MFISISMIMVTKALYCHAEPQDCLSLSDDLMLDQPDLKPWFQILDLETAHIDMFIVVFVSHSRQMVG